MSEWSYVRDEQVKAKIDAIIEALDELLETLSEPKKSKFKEKVDKAKKRPVLE